MGCRDKFTKKLLDVDSSVYPVQGIRLSSDVSVPISTFHSPSQVTFRRSGIDDDKKLHRPVDFFHIMDSNSLCVFVS